MYDLDLGTKVVGWGSLPASCINTRDALTCRANADVEIPAIFYRQYVEDPGLLVIDIF